MNRKKLLKRFNNSNFNNVSFSDFVSLVEDHGFTLSRMKGSHHIYSHKKINELVNIQKVQGEVKPYQIKQFLKLIEKYGLKLND